MHDFFNIDHITFIPSMKTMNEAAAESQAERDAENRYEMWQSEADEAAELNMTVEELRAEKELHRIYKEETETYENLTSGIY